MGDGDTIPSESSPKQQHSSRGNRFETSTTETFQSRSSSDSGTDWSSTGEVKQWLASNNRLKNDDSKDLFSQATYDTEDAVHQHSYENEPGEQGPKSSWSEIDSSDVGAGSLSSSRKITDATGFTSLMNSDGEMHDESRPALKHGNLRETLDEAVDEFGQEHVKSLASKIHRLRGEHGQFNFHDEEVYQQFTTTEKQVILSMETATVTGSDDPIDKLTDGNGEFMGESVYFESDIGGIADELDNGNNVIVATHSNKNAAAVKTKIDEFASNGQLPGSLNADELADKLGECTTTANATILSPEEGVSGSKQAESFVNSISRSGDINPTQRTEVDKVFNDGELQVIGDAVLEADEIEFTSGDNVDGDFQQQFQTEFMRTLGSFASHSYMYTGDKDADIGSQALMRGEAAAVLVEDPRETGVNFDMTYTTDGEVYKKNDGRRENEDPIEGFTANSMRVVYAETSLNSDGEIEVNDIITGKLDDFVTDNNKMKMHATPDFEEGKTKVVGDDPTSEKPEIKRIENRDSDEVANVQSKEDPQLAKPTVEKTDAQGNTEEVTTANAPPRPETVPEIQDLTEKLEDGIVGETVMTSERDVQKETGNYSEDAVISVLYPYQDIGASEKNQFPDIPSGMIEVKSYSGESDGNEVALGTVHQPWEDHFIDNHSSKATEGSHGDWSKENFEPKNVRFVILERESIDTDNMDVTKQTVNRLYQKHQTTHDLDDFVNDDFIDSDGQLKPEVASASDSEVVDLSQDVKENLEVISNAVIVSGDAIDEHADELNAHEDTTYERLRPPGKTDTVDSHDPDNGPDIRRPTKQSGSTGQSDGQTKVDNW